MSNDDYMAELNQQELEEQQQLSELFTCSGCGADIDPHTMHGSIGKCAKCWNNQQDVPTISPAIVPRETQQLWEREAQIHGGSRDE